MAPKKAYNYFDSPAGYDLFEKTRYVMVPTLLTALGLGFGEVIAVSRPQGLIEKGLLSTIKRIAYIGTPIVLSSVVFLIVTNGLAIIREKDDTRNWCAGGFFAGSVYGLYVKHKMMAFNFGLFFAGLALMKKSAVDHNFPLFSETIRYPIQRDFTYTKQRPGNWTTGE